MSTQTGPNATYTIREDGRTMLSSNGLWFRYLRALADLFIGRRITFDAMADGCIGYTQAISDAGDLVAWRLFSTMVSLADEGYESDDKLRALLRERIGD